MRRLTLALWLGALVASLAAQVPTPQGPINDFAQILDDATEARLRDAVEAVERETSAEIAVATVPSLNGGSIEELATRYFNSWGIGQKGLNNGILILVAPTERQVRIEVGYGLEPILPDGLAGDVVRRDMLPTFREGRFAAGVVAAVDRLATIVRVKHVVTPAELEALARDAEDRPPRWLMIPFLGVFFTIGGYVAGSSLKSKDGASLMFGLFFAGVPAVLSLIPFFNAPPLILMPWFGLMMAQGFRTTARGEHWTWPKLSRGRRAGNGSSSSGSVGSSGSSSSSSSSSSSFGGGSSGGGGASGRW